MSFLLLNAQMFGVDMIFVNAYESLMLTMAAFI